MLNTQVFKNTLPFLNSSLFFVSALEYSKEINRIILELLCIIFYSVLKDSAYFRNFLDQTKILFT